jgi:subtilisin-like proprotein convertase family protein
LVVTGSPRDASFEAFLATLGSNSPDGSWTLAISDLESGNLARMTGWGMTLTGVPEVEEYAVMSGAGLVLFWVWRRRQTGTGIR